MTDRDKNSKFVSIYDASMVLFGEGGNSGRRRIKLMIEVGRLDGQQLTGEGRGSPYWVTRSSLDALIKKLDENEPNQAA